LSRWPAVQPIPVLIDYTTLAGVAVLFAALPFQGHAIPIAFHAFRYANLTGSQNLLEEER